MVADESKSSEIDFHVRCRSLPTFYKTNCGRQLEKINSCVEIVRLMGVLILFITALLMKFVFVCLSESKRTGQIFKGI